MWMDAFVSVAVVVVGVIARPIVARVGVPRGVILALGLAAIVCAGLLAAFGAITGVLLMVRMHAWEYLPRHSYGCRCRVPLRPELDTACHSEGVAPPRGVSTATPTADVRHRWAGRRVWVQAYAEMGVRAIHRCWSVSVWSAGRLLRVADRCMPDECVVGVGAGAFHGVVVAWGCHSSPAVVSDPAGQSEWEIAGRYSGVVRFLECRPVVGLGRVLTGVGCHHLADFRERGSPLRE